MFLFGTIVTKKRIMREENNRSEIKKQKDLFYADSISLWLHLEFFDNTD